MTSIGLAASVEERIRARAFALTHNGANFCPQGQEPSILDRAIASYPEERVDWIVACDSGGNIIGVSAFVIDPDSAFALHSLNTTIDPSRYTTQLARNLVRAIGELAPWPDGDRGWFAIMSSSSPALDLVLEAYAPVTVSDYAGGEGLVRLEGLMSRGDD